VGAARSRDIRWLTRGPKWHGSYGPQWCWLLGWLGEKENGPSLKRIVIFLFIQKISIGLEFIRSNGVLPKFKKNKIKYLFVGN
jgi:hypothetical protein